jgi:signal transduction histidine kinase
MKGDTKKENQKVHTATGGGIWPDENTILGMFAGAYFMYNFDKKEFIGTGSLDQLLAEMLETRSVSIKHFLDSLTPEDKVNFQELFSDAKALKKKLNFQFRIIPKLKDYREIQTFAFTGVYTVNPQGEAVLVCVIRNISRETKILRDLQRNLDRAEESDRIKSLFLLNISHNIRTPMNSILGFAELLSLTDPEPERRRDYIKVIRKQSKNLIQLIDDVAEIAKFESGQMTMTRSSVNLNLLLGEIKRDVETMRSTERKEQVQILLKLPDNDGLEIFTDAGRLHQVFINLVNHSLKYTLEGFVELGYRMPEDSKISFYIKDTSRGVSKDDLKLILDKSGQSEKNVHNRYDEEIGLNLSIAKSIVKLLGGKLSVETNPDKGIEFLFTIPYEKIPALPLENDFEELSINRQFKWNDKVILIVEDEEVNGLFLEAVFQETGARTLYAKNGRQAVELCRSMQNKIDLILMDIKMPVMNGLKATQEIRKFNQTVPIIAQTALAMEEDKHQCLLAGCNDTITKPIEIDELLQRVNSYFI